MVHCVYLDVQIKVLIPDRRNQFFPPEDKILSFHNIPPKQKDPSMDKAPFRSK